MRNLSKLAIVALTATAFAASAAPALGLTVTNEATGTACSAVSSSGTSVSGGCLIHATSETTIFLRKHVFGVESDITSCNNEFASRLNGSGSGYIFEQVLSGAGCARQACKSGSEGTPWAASGSDFGSLILTTNFCVEPVGGGTDETCEIDIPFGQELGTHNFEFSNAGELPSHGISGFRCELAGHWSTETGGTHDGSSETGAETTGGGGGGGGEHMTVSPSSLEFSDTATWKEVTIKNIGASSWKIFEWSVPANFTGDDPNHCLVEANGKNRKYNPNDSCKVKIRATALNKTGNFSVTNDYLETKYVFLDS